MSTHMRTILRWTIPFTCTHTWPKYISEALKTLKSEWKSILSRLRGEAIFEFQMSPSDSRESEYSATQTRVHKCDEAAGAWHGADKHHAERETVFQSGGGGGGKWGKFVQIKKEWPNALNEDQPRERAWGVLMPHHKRRKTSQLRMNWHKV